MDTLPDWTTPPTPDGFEFVGMRVPRIGDYLTDFHGKPYVINKSNKEYHFEKHPVYRKKVA